MRAGPRGALEVANSRGDSRPVGGGVEEGAGDLLPRSECPWYPGRSEEPGGWLSGVGDGG